MKDLSPSGNLSVKRERTEGKFFARKIARSRPSPDPAKALPYRAPASEKDA